MAGTYSIWFSSLNMGKRHIGEPKGRKKGIDQLGFHNKIP